MDSWAIAAASDDEADAEAAATAAAEWAAAAAGSEAGAASAAPAPLQPRAPEVAAAGLATAAATDSAPDRPPKRLRKSALLREALADAGVAAFDRSRQLAEARSHRRAPEQSPRAQAEGPQPGHALAVASTRRVPSVPDVVMKGLSAPAPQLGCWPLAGIFRAFMLGQGSLRPADPEATDTTTKLSRYFVGGRSGRISTRASAADHLQVDSRRFVDHLLRLANTALHVDREGRATLERLVAQIPNVQLIAYVDGARYDETPMPVAVSLSDTFGNDVPAQAGALPTVALTSALPKMGGPVRNATKSGAQSHKLLQSESSFGMLVRIGGELTTILGKTLSWLQHLQRTTAECLAEAARQRDSTTDVANQFAFRARLSTLDRYAGGEKCEKALVGERDALWHRLALSCEVHMTAGTHKKVFQITSADISGQINLALSLNFGTGLSLFRKHLRQHIMQKVVVLKGDPPAECQAVRRHLLRLCCSRGPRLLQRKAMLMALPNGDWRRRDRIEVWVPNVGVEYDHSQIAESVAASLLAVLAGCQFTVYPRHRWTRSDEAFDEFILLEGIHGLASAAFGPWAAEVAGRGSSAGAQGVSAPGAPGLPLEDMPPQLEGVILDEDRPSLVAPEEDVPSDSAFESSWERARVEHDTNRRRAAEWLATNPLPRALIIRQVMEPLRRLMSAQLTMSGARWQATQASGATQQDPSSPHAGRTFPLLEAARGTLETAFQADVAMLLAEPTLWSSLIPLAARTLAHRSLAFRLLSAAGCLVEETMGHPHRQCPFRLFLLLESDAQAAALQQLPPCMLDEFSAAFIAPHRDEPAGLSSDTAKAKAALFGHLAKTDIAQIEAQHASVRRRLFARGVQTHAHSLVEVSAERVCDRVRHDGLRWANAPHEAQRQSAQGDASATGLRRKRGDYGGPWRAFVRERSLGSTGVPDLKELGIDYAQLGAEDRQRLEEMGREAREAKLAGAAGGSFGLTTRQVQRRQKRSTKQAAITNFSSGLGAAEGSHGDRRQQALDMVLAQPNASNLEGVVATARAVVADAERVSRQAEGDAVARLEEWQSNQGRASVTRFTQAKGGLERFEGFLQGEPASEGSAVAWAHPTGCTATLCGLAQEDVHKSNLSRAMVLDWIARHRPIYHEECRPLPNTERPPKVPPCWRLGFCACGGGGLVLQMARAGFLKAMKATFPPKSEFRTLLEEKSIVARVHMSRPPVEDAWAEAAAEADGVDLGGVDRHVFWHVGCHSFSPYRSTMRVMKFKRECDGQAPREIELEAMTQAQDRQSLPVQQLSSPPPCTPARPTRPRSPIFPKRI